MEAQNVGKFEIEFTYPRSTGAYTNGGPISWAWEATSDRAWLPSESFLLLKFTAAHRLTAAPHGLTALTAAANQFRNFPGERAFTSFEHKMNKVQVSYEPSYPAEASRGFLGYYAERENNSVGNAVCGARADKAQQLANGTATTFSQAIRIPLGIYQSRKPIYGGRHELFAQMLAPGAIDANGNDLGKAMIHAGLANNGKYAIIIEAALAVAYVKPLKEVALAPTVKMNYRDHQLIRGRAVAANTYSPEQFVVPQTTTAIILSFSDTNDTADTAIRAGLKSFQVRFRGKTVPQTRYDTIWDDATDLSGAVRAFAESAANMADLGIEGNVFWDYDDWVSHPIYVIDTSRLPGDADTQLTLYFEHTHNHPVVASLMCLTNSVLGMKFTNNVLDGIKAVRDADDIEF